MQLLAVGQNLSKSPFKSILAPYHRSPNHAIKLKAPSLLCLSTSPPRSLGISTKVVFTNETAPEHVKALHASIIAASSSLGSLLGVIIVIIVESATTEGALALAGVGVGVGGRWGGGGRHV